MTKFLLSKVPWLKPLQKIRNCEYKFQPLMGSRVQKKILSFYPVSELEEEVSEEPLIRFDECKAFFFFKFSKFFLNVHLLLSSITGTPSYFYMYECRGWVS